MGGAGAEDGSEHACLPTALRNLGYDVTATRDGPFSAIDDGSRCLAPFGMRLAASDLLPSQPGSYVAWSADHFTALEVGQRVLEIDGTLTRDFASMAAFAASQPRGLRFFRVEPANARRHAPREHDTARRLRKRTAAVAFVRTTENYATMDQLRELAIRLACGGGGVYSKRCCVFHPQCLIQLARGPHSREGLSFVLSPGGAQVPERAEDVPPEPHAF